MIITWGYHHYYHGQVTRPVLDQICPDKPLIVWHRSFHELVANTRALQIIEFEVENTKDNKTLQDDIEG